MNDTMMILDHAYWIALMPFLMAFVIFFFGRWFPKQSALLSIVAIAACLLFSIDLFMRCIDGSLKLPQEVSYLWFSIGGTYDFSWGILIDGLSLVMLMVVCGVSLLVQIYSVGYMHDSPRLPSFFAYMSLFTSGMLIVVLANNYLQFFIGWEIMGLCSYLLIRFEQERLPAGFAANKAFLTTRLGDLGLYAALLLIFVSQGLGTFHFGQIQEHVMDHSVPAAVSGLIGLLIFAGVVGKSAQFPLHVWLPDAMEGPTPVSALIHSATMVAAGVYLCARSFMFFAASPETLTVITWTGAITAFFAATIAITASDIKKVLAYSTISQLGYMVMAIGLSGYSASLFHMTTHAAFKALLFLAAGSVIHSVHSNNIWKMGSLSKQMAITFTTFAIGGAALAGVPPFAGFFSKDLILTQAWATHQWPIFGLALLTAGMTAFYITRLVALVFLGNPRERDRFAHAKESPLIMTIPLMVLALFAAITGWLFHSPETLEKFFGYPGLLPIEESHIPMLLALGVSAIGIFTAGVLYTGPLDPVTKLGRGLAPLHAFLSNKWFIDELYDVIFLKPLAFLTKLLDQFDRVVIDRVLVDGVTDVLRGIRSLSARISLTHPETFLQESVGWVQLYLLIFVAGFVGLVFWSLR